MNHTISELLAGPWRSRPAVGGPRSSRNFPLARNRGRRSNRDVLCRRRNRSRETSQFDFLRKPARCLAGGFYRRAGFLCPERNPARWPGHTQTHRAYDGSSRSGRTRGHPNSPAPEKRENEELRILRQLGKLNMANSFGIHETSQDRDCPPMRPAHV